MLVSALVVTEGMMSVVLRIFAVFMRIAEMHGDQIEQAYLMLFIVVVMMKMVNERW